MTLPNLTVSRWPHNTPPYRLQSEAQKLFDLLEPFTGSGYASDVVGNIEPLIFNTTLTGAGATGGRARYQLNADAALGGWSNALKAITVYGAAGKTAGLGSAFVAEMTMSAGTVDGTYAPVEIELNVPSGAALGTLTSLIHMSVNDTPAGFDTAGFLFNLQGLTPDTGKCFDTLTAVDVQASARLRCKVGATTYYIPLSALEGLNDS